ncbi:hypothetical protein APB26_31775 [Pseudomonas aeruginosa]|nr:hypothetical protein APB26_31775 [Pseudomonas aeruginosa]RPV61237.1 hypothetical protein IPC838_18100 [Pseudomonas aeruginosa]
MLPASAASAYISTDHDSVWAVVDHSLKTVLFGPEDGIRVTTQDRGIATYLVGQLIRLLRTKNESAAYRVLELEFPSKPAGEPAEAWDEAIQKTTTLLENQGFRVSKTTGGIVANAQSLGSLAERWNSEKISYISNSRLMSLYNEAVQQEARSQAQLEELSESNRQLEQDAGALLQSLQRIEELTTAASLKDEEITRLSEQVATLTPYQAEVRSLREELEVTRDNLNAENSVRATPSDAPPIVPAPSLPTAHAEAAQGPMAPQVSTTIDHTHRLTLGRFERWTVGVVAAALITLGFVNVFI